MKNILKLIVSKPTKQKKRRGHTFVPIERTFFVSAGAQQRVLGLIYHNIYRTRKINFQ